MVEPPVWKICSSNWIHLPQGSGWTWKIFELPPPSLLVLPFKKINNEYLKPSFRGAFHKKVRAFLTKPFSPSGLVFCPGRYTGKKLSGNPATPSKLGTYLVDILVWTVGYVTLNMGLGLHVGGPTTQFLSYGDLNLNKNTKNLPHFSHQVCHLPFPPIRSGGVWDSFNEGRVAVDLGLIPFLVVIPYFSKRTHMITVVAVGVSKRIQVRVCPKKRISRTILFWRWDWDRQSYWIGRGLEDS